MSCSFTGAEPGLVCFRCDEGGGGVLLDAASASPNFNHQGWLTARRLSFPAWFPCGGGNGSGACESCFVVSGHFDTKPEVRRRRSHRSTVCLRPTQAVSRFFRVAWRAGAPCPATSPATPNCDCAIARLPRHAGWSHRRRGVLWRVSRQPTLLVVPRRRRRLRLARTALLVPRPAADKLLLVVVTARTRTSFAIPTRWNSSTCRTPNIAHRQGRRAEQSPVAMEQRVSRLSAPVGERLEFFRPCRFQ